MANRTLSRRHRWSRRAVVGLALGATAVMTAPTAAATTLDNIPGAEHCDTEGDPQGACVGVAINGGTFDNNGFQLPVKEGDMVLSVGFPADGSTFTSTDTENFGVYAKPMTVPGGVLGVDLPFDNLFGLAAVTAEVQAVAVPVMHDEIFDFNIDMPVRMKLNNAFLGDNCYLGSAESPVTFELRGVRGGALDPVYNVVGGPDYPEGTLQVTNVHTAAKDFALPGATGCGPFGALNPIVNWRAKTPATTGTSLAVQATAYMYAPGDLVATPSPEEPGGSGSAGSSGSSGSSGS